MKPITIAALFLSLILLTAGQPPQEEEEEEEEEEEDEDEDGEPPPSQGPPLQPMCDLANLYGYKCEEHKLVTKDGYKLEMYRIPPTKDASGTVIMLVHGLMLSSEVFAIFNNSIAYQLADEGHDVWLAAMRGSIHGRNHTIHNPDTDFKFWDFSWQDVGLLDIPAQVDYVTEKTGKQEIHYLGHSLGSIVFLLMASKMPETASKLKTTTLVAPIYYYSKYQFMLKEGSSMYNMAMETMKGFDEKQKWELFPRSDIPKNEHQIFCEDLPTMAVTYCNMGMEMTRQKVGEFLPAGTSKKMIDHLQQNVMTGKSKLFNYGEEQNKVNYNQTTPPEIDLKSIKNKIYLFYCASDHLAANQDVEALLKEITVESKLFIEDEDFNHMDFIFPTSEENEKNFQLVVQTLKDNLKK